MEWGYSTLFPLSGQEGCCLYFLHKCWNQGGHQHFISWIFIWWCVTCIITYWHIQAFWSLFYWCSFLLNHLLFDAENSSVKTKTCILKWNCVYQFWMEMSCGLNRHWTGTSWSQCLQMNCQQWNFIHCFVLLSCLDHQDILMLVKFKN